MYLCDLRKNRSGTLLTHVLACFRLCAAVKRFREPVGIRRPWRIWSESLTINTRFEKIIKIQPMSLLLL